MGTTEKPDNRLYEQPTESPGECPSFFQVIDELDEILADANTLVCSTCGVILSPVEITLDLGDGPELLCDGCLGINN